MKREKYLSKAIICSLMTASAVSIYTGTAFAGDSYPNGYYIDGGQVAKIYDATFSSEDIDNQSALRVKGDGTKLTLNNATILAGEAGPDEGGELIVNNSTIRSYDFNTEGGTITASNSNINSPVHAGYIYKDDYNDEGSRSSTITINNSNITASNEYEPDGSIVAGIGGKIYLNGDKNTKYYPGTFIGSIAEDTNGTNAGQIILNGGTLVADDLRATLDGSRLTTRQIGLDQNELNELRSRIAKKNIILQNDGVIQTKTGQIFAKGIDTSSRQAVLNSKDSGKVTNDYIRYNGGTLKFTDKEYTQDYLNSAKQNISTVDSGTTKIVMTGDLVDKNGVVKQYISIADAINNGPNVYTRQIVQTDPNIAVLSIDGTSVEGKVNGDTQNANSFNAARLKVGENTNQIIVTGKNNKLGLGSNEDGDLVYGNNGTMKIDIKNSGTLELGVQGLTEKHTVQDLTANLSVDSSTLNSFAGQNNINGTLTMKTATANINGSSALNVNGTLTSDKDSRINVGDGSTSGTLTADSADLNGTTVELKSVYKDGGTINDGSKAALNLKDNKLNNTFKVGQNSTLSLGTDDTAKAEQAFAKSGLNWGKDVTSAMYVAGKQDLTNGQIGVNSSTKNNGETNFGDKSMLMVNGLETNNGQPVITADKVTVDKNSKLYIDNADKGTYTILTANSIQNDGWKDDNISSNIALIGFKDVSDANNIKVLSSYKKVSEVYGNDVVIGNVVDSVLQSDKYKVGNPAYDFFRSAADRGINSTRAQQVDAFNSAANLGELGGANHATYSMSNIMTDSVADHLSLALHEYNQGDIWAKYIHSKEDVDGMKLGGLAADYSASFDGITVGGDFYNKGKGTIGAAFSYAKGDIDGYTLSSRTKNDADYYGLSLYGRIDNGDSALLGDISYLHGSNDIKQYNSGTEITASPDSDAFSIGLRAEKLFKAGENGKIVPYAGLRYMHLGTGSYTNNLGMSYDANNQNLWLIPVGVRFTTEIKQRDWTISPYAEAGYVWTAGDREADQSVSLNGGIDTFGFETADKGSFIGKLGVQAESDKMAYGLGYEYQNGDTVSADRWMANVTFKF